MQAGFDIGRHGALRAVGKKSAFLLAIAETVLALAQARISERRERGVIKPFGRGNVAYADGDMIDHQVFLR